MRLTNLNFIEAFNYATRGESVHHRTDNGPTDYALMNMGSTDLPRWRVTPMLASLGDRSEMELSCPHLILSNGWEVRVKNMDFKQACAYSAKHFIPCKRVGSTARIEIDRNGELWYSSMSPGGSLIRTLTQKDIEAEDWVPL